jgi:inner membrane protein
MTARTHDAFAFASLITVAAYYPPEILTLPTVFTCIVANIVGGLLPDMDQAGNRLWDLLPAGNIVGKIFRRIFISHRSISHSVLGGYILYRILLIILPILLNDNYIQTYLVLWSIMIGFASHLLADAITKEGIPLFFPFSFKLGIPPLVFLRVKTGSWVENLIVLPGVSFYIFWLISYNQPLFFDLFARIQK